MNNRLDKIRLPSILLLAFLLFSGCSGEQDGDEAKEISKDQSSIDPTVQVPSEVVPVEVSPQETIADECAASASPEENLERARDLAKDKHSPDSLACAAVLYARIAELNADDIDSQVEAMSVMEDALFYLRVIQTLDLMGVDKVNTDRIESIGLNYLKLATSSNAKAGNDPRVMIHRALAIKESEGAYDTVMLEKAIASRPDALNGLAQVRLGRMLFELPSILGGDFPAAIALFEQAVEIDPNNMQALYYLAEVYEQEMEEKKAASIMARMLDVSPVDAQLQMSTDMLRLAIGLSQRIGKIELSEKLKEQRQALLAAHSDLMTRVSVAVGGHGGVNPLTGE